MGCVSSKDHQKVCQKCQVPYSSSSAAGASRIYSSSRSKPDSIHLDNDDEQKKMNEVIMDFPMATAVIEAKNWSDMIEKKIPKIISKTTQDMNMMTTTTMSSTTTTTTTPPGESTPETINTWELMEGLEDMTNSPLPRPSFSFHVVTRNPLEEEEEETTGESSPENDSNSSTSVTAAPSELNKEEISSFRKELEELNPANPFHLNPLLVYSTDEEEEETNGKKEDQERVVLYFTSLRGVRKTYKECCYVRVTLRELGFIVDERDVSMHSGFKGELKELLLREGEGDEEVEEGFGLPRVFVGKKEKKYIGGAEEIRHLHEEGELKKTLEGCERLRSGSRRRVCEGCGDVGFVPCETCCGSCKIFNEHEDLISYNQDEEDEEEEECDESTHEYGFQRCPDCNENGLIRCPICC